MKARGMLHIAVPLGLALLSLCAHEAQARGGAGGGGRAAAVAARPAPVRVAPRPPVVRDTPEATRPITPVIVPHMSAAPASAPAKEKRKP